ncbi:MAG: hypothetical protein HQL87_17755 [Magnetococcales bacterium]|nr:hypothetical protein [Magnetococcales bacterium]
MVKFSNIIEPVSIMSGVMASLSSLATPTGVSWVLAKIGFGNPIAVAATVATPVLAKIAAVVSIVSGSVWALEKMMEKIKNNASAPS